MTGNRCDDEEVDIDSMPEGLAERIEATRRRVLKDRSAQMREWERALELLHRAEVAVVEGSVPQTKRYLLAALSIEWNHLLPTDETGPIAELVRDPYGTGEQPYCHRTWLP